MRPERAALLKMLEQPVDVQMKEATVAQVARLEQRLPACPSPSIPPLAPGSE